MKANHFGATCDGLLSKLPNSAEVKGFVCVAVFELNRRNPKVLHLVAILCRQGRSTALRSQAIRICADRLRELSPMDSSGRSV
jgi:hypothetical protein